MECTRCSGTLFSLFIYYICVQPCITILVGYSHNKAYNDLLLFELAMHAFAKFLLVDFAQPWRSNSI